MMHRAILLALVAVAWLAPASWSCADYLGKPATQWHKELLASTSAEAKRNAAFALGKCRIEAWPAISDLIRIAGSDSEDPGVRETAAFAIGQIAPKDRQHDAIFNLLCKLATDKIDERIKRSAVVALGTCGSDTPQIRATLEKAMGDEHKAVCQNAAWALGEICQSSDNPPVASLIKGLRNSDKLVKRDAALALGKIVNYQTGDGPEQLDRIAKIRDKAREALGPLLDCVKHDYLELKKAACATLIPLVNDKDVQAKAVLTEACQHADVEVRCNAALALARIGGDGSKAAIKVLQEALRGNDPALRQSVVLAFKDIGPDAAIALPDLLWVLAKDPDVKVRHYTAVALGGLKTDANKIVPALVDRVVDINENADVRVSAAMSLQFIGHCEEATKAMSRLASILNDPTQPVRVRERILWAMRVHGSDLVGNSQVVQALTKVLTEEKLRDPSSGGKMLRYDSAYLLSVYNRVAKAPDEVFPVLLDFLKDPTVRIFTGINTKFGGTGEGAKPQAGVKEQGGQDGRVMVIQALEQLGYNRVASQPQILQTLQEMRDGTLAVDQPLRDAATKLLKEWGK